MSLGFSFLICKMGTMMTPSLWYCEDPMRCEHMKYLSQDLQYEVE
jgi:hypothetical protein